MTNLTEKQMIEIESAHPQMEMIGFTPDDNIRVDLIPIIEQWRINKSADLVDRVLRCLCKN